MVNEDKQKVTHHLLWELYPDSMRNMPAHYGNREMFKHKTSLGPMMETNHEYKFDTVQQHSFTRVSQAQGNPEYPLRQHQTEQQTLPMDLNIVNSAQTDSFDAGKVDPTLLSSQSAQNDHIPSSFDVQTPQFTSMPNEDKELPIERVCQAKGDPSFLLNLQSTRNKNLGESNNDYSSMPTDLSAREIEQPKPRERNVSLNIFM